MTIKLWLAGIDVQVPHVVEDPGGTVRVPLNDRGDWLTLENRADCAMLMQAAADADSVFIRQKARAEAVEVVAAGLAPADLALKDVSRPGHGAQRDAAIPIRTLERDGRPAGYETAGPGHSYEDMPVIAPECDSGDHENCRDDMVSNHPCDCYCHAPLPQRIPGGPPEREKPRPEFEERRIEAELADPYDPAAFPDSPPKRPRKPEDDLPPLPQRIPGGPPEDDEGGIVCGDIIAGLGEQLKARFKVQPEDDLPPLPQRIPGGPPDEPFPADNPELNRLRAVLRGEERPEPQPGGTIYPELSPEALAEAAPLVPLAPEPQEEAGT